MTMPSYWMQETSGVLAPAVMRYLNDEPLSTGDIGALRAYLRIWIKGNWRGGAALDDLRARINDLTSRSAIHAWLDDALELGIDPL